MHLPHPPSATALRVALRRAAHQVLDEPRVFDDPLALPILGLERETAAAPEHGWLDDTPMARVLRASLAARSRFAEDLLHQACQQGVRQYVILGAGLDTFAYRSGPSDGLQVFEVDHPTMQAWKRQHLETMGIVIPAHCTFAPVDFERQTLAEGLQSAGFASSRPAFFSWLGVTMYLTADAVNATLAFVASLPAGSGIVFDYLTTPALLSPPALRAFTDLARRVAAIGEPFQTFFDPEVLAQSLAAFGFREIADTTPTAMDARYFHDRSDGLRAGKLSHVMTAWV